MLFFLLATSRKLAQRIDIEFGDATGEIAADRSWIVLPGGCATITWDLEGIHSLYIDGQGQIGWGEMEYCPTISAPSPEFDITTQDGTVRRFTLDFHYLLNVLVFVLGFVGMISAGVSVLYGVLNLHGGRRFPLWGITIAILTLLLIGEFIRLSGNPMLIRDFRSTLKSVFANPDWHLFGILLAGLIYVPLIVEALRRVLRSKRITDLIVLGSFLLFVLLLYLPFGFDSIGHWEEWNINAWLDGRSVWFLEDELISRFWAIVPHTLSYLISSDSFAGYQLLNFLMFWGKLVLLYGILRQFRVDRLYAFLITILFMVYPVNSALMSTRSLPMQFSMTALLAAVYLMLEYEEHPSRLHLLGIWLGLLFNVGSIESAYVIILVIPLLWWLRNRQLGWRNLNLTVIWYMFPALKLAYLLLLSSANQFYYHIVLLEEILPSDNVLTMIAIPTHEIVNVYHHTFMGGWQEALTAMGQNVFMALTVVMLFLVAGVAWFLTGKTKHPSPRATLLALVSGLVFIIPSVGILIWFQTYNSDLWRLYFYVPIGAATVLFSLIALLTAPIVKVRHRDAVIVMLCIIFMFPAISRLLLQHEDIVKSANNKAWVLRQVIEQAPEIDRRTHLVLLTDMSNKELKAKKIYDLRLSYTLYSMLYVLYQDGYPPYVSFCQIGLDSTCKISGAELTDYNADKGFDFQDLLLFRLSDDLSVELLDKLSAAFDFAVDSHYHPNQLYNPDAPIPPRALTMLASARRD